MNTPHNPGGQPRDGGSRPGTGSEGEELKQSARQFAEQAEHEGKARAEHARESAADNLGKLADGARAAASELEDNDAGQLSDYVANAADRMTRLSGDLRKKSVDELMGDVARFAREQPALFLTGSLAVGFGLARFARASQPQPEARSSATGSSSDEIRRRGSDSAGRPRGGESGSTSFGGYPPQSSTPQGDASRSGGERPEDPEDRSSSSKHGGLH